MKKTKTEESKEQVICEACGNKSPIETSVIDSDCCYTCIECDTKYKEDEDIATKFEKEIYKVINKHCKNGLKKPDLISKMQYITGSCIIS